MELRPTRADDLPVLEAVFRAAITELYERHSLPPPNPPAEAVVAQHEHLLTHDAERCFVAKVDDRTVGFVAAFARDDAWFLASLFVLPAYQRRGVGRALLDAAWGIEHERRQTLTDSIQPVSNTAYARRGLFPFTPMLSLSGSVVAGRPPGVAAGPVDAAAIAAIDAAAYGFDRAVDHAYWRRHASATLWTRAGEPVAYSYGWPHGRIGPVAGIDAEAAGAAVRAELSRTQGHAVVVAPGTATGVVEAGLEAGLRFTGPPGLLLLSRTAHRPDALAISSYTLF